MKYTFMLRNRAVTVATIDAIAAVQPTTDLRSAQSKRELTRRFGAPPPDDTRGGKVGLVLPARNRKLFEQAGWVFVEGSAAVSRAAETRSSIEGAQTVRRVYLGRSGTMIGTDRATVQFDPDVTQAEVRARLKKDKLHLVRRLAFAENTYEVRIPPRRPELEVVQELQAETGRYRFVEPVLLEAITGRHTPSDPKFSSQWQHRNNGANGGVAGADLKSETAWDRTRGAGVRLAVIDNGMQVNHPDLRDGIVGGAYFVSDATHSALFQNWNPGDPGFPDGDHGTFCLGMAGARMDNKLGGCGSAPEADLLAIACLTDQVGSQTDPGAGDRVRGQPDHRGSQRISRRGRARDRVQPRAEWCRLGHDLGPGTGDHRCSCGRAAGAGGADPLGGDERTLRHRARRGVLASGRARDFTLQQERFGRRRGVWTQAGVSGARVDVYSTESGSGYGFSTGCSFAAPLAAGVAALVLSRYPTWTAAQVRRRLADSCDKVGGVTYDAHGRHNEYGYGRLNAERRSSRADSHAPRRDTRGQD